MKKKTSLKQFCRALKAHDNYLLACHVNPEGDALGSLLAMDSLLRRLGKKTTVVGDDVFPRRLSALSSKRWRLTGKVRKMKRTFPALIVTDCPNMDRIGNVRHLITPETIVFNIDHHISNIYFGKYNYVLPKAAASGEVVFDFFKELRMRIRAEEAKNMYVALSTDTGSFKYSNTSVHSHHVAAELISTGIDIGKINEEVYSTFSMNKIRLHSRLLSRVKTAARGQVAWAAVKRKDLKETKTTYEDTEGFIDYLKFLKPVRAAFFISESQAPRQVKVSFRAKGSYDVNKVARFFNGGGHKKASGCTIHMDLKRAEKQVLKRILKDFR